MQVSCEKPACDCLFEQNIVFTILNAKGEDITDQFDAKNVKLTYLNSPGDPVRMEKSCADKSFMFVLFYKSGLYRLDLGNGISKEINVTYNLATKGCCKGYGGIERVQVDGKAIEGRYEICSNTKSYPITI
ncbi:hypothetical protein GCM10023189_21540 [Nibrella saemangeumensis]|uniref:Uncharacterized protein n=2 Tax=Nibrella saemangeumensis TaxID=1084526 RepID=A0ABP8MUT5_9BACT